MLKRSLCSSLAIIYFLTLGTPLATLAQDHTAPVAEARNVETVTQSVQREPVQATELAAADRERVNVPVVDGEQRGRLPAETPSSPEVLPDARPLNLPTGPGQSAVTPQAIQLPQAEGSIRGMGESFSPSLSAGTGTYSVPIAVPAGRAGLQASLGLSYSTGGGNGPVGYGWSIGAPFIARQSDKGLPRYLDRAAWHVEEDRFFFNGGQELVPVSDADALALDGVGPPAECVGWQQYRARVEGGFMRFYRHFDTATQRTDRWLVFGKDGSRLELGAFSGGGPTEVASDPFNALQTENADGSGRVYMWYLVRTSDAHGASMYHRYRKDGGQQYLSEIYYTSPADCGVALNPAATRACARPLRDYAHRVALQYGAREDVSTSYLSTWRIRTALRLTRVDISAAMGAPSGGRSHVRRYHLTYKSGSWHSLLESVQMEGRPQTLDTDGIARGITNVPEGASDPRGERLPAMRFTYSEPRANTPPIAGFGGINATVMMSPSSPPSSVDETRADLFDVNSDGLTDLIVTDPARYRMPDGSPAVGVFFNGFTGTDARPAVAGGFSAAVPVPMPSSLSGVMTLSNLNIVPMDIDGDGRSDMLHMPRLRDYGYFTVTRGGASTDIETSPARQRFGFSYVPVTLPNSDQDPRIDLGRDGEHLRIMDVNQDHLVDVVRTAGTQMQTWLNLGWLKNPGSDDPIGDAALAPRASRAIAGSCRPSPSRRACQSPARLSTSTTRKRASPT